MANINGFIGKNCKNSYLQLKYSKRESTILCGVMYDSKLIPRLERKYQKILRSLEIINNSRGGEIGRRAAFRAQ